MVTARLGSLTCPPATRFGGGTDGTPSRSWAGRRTLRSGCNGGGVMSDEYQYTASPDESYFVRESSDEGVARHWGVLLAVGIPPFASGGALSLWPGEKVVVL